MNVESSDSRPGIDLVDDLVQGVVASVANDMRGQQASLVYQILQGTLSRRLPGIPVDEELMRTAAARISLGLAPCA